MFRDECSKRNKFIYIFIIIALAIFSIFGISQYLRAERLEVRASNSYNRAFYSLTDSIREIDSSLEKIMLAVSPTQISALASDIYSECSAAISSISQLPESEDMLFPVLKFLSQSGDYTAYISAKVTDSGEISDEEFQNLKELAHHAEIVNNEISRMAESLAHGTFSYEAPKKNVAYALDELNYTGGMEKIYKEFVNYPTLIYDGPFSEHQKTDSPRALIGKDSVTQSEALEIATLYLGEERSQNLTVTGEKNYDIESYMISKETEDRQISIEITKKGGMPLWFLDSREVGGENLTIDEAKTFGAKYLRSMGYNSMEESYYEKNGSTVTINYAFKQDEIIAYPDLIKLKIALDNGEIVGFESKGYISSHHVRPSFGDIISAREAQEKISPHLLVKSVRLAYIPKENGSEILCYEFSGEFNDRKFLIYLNAKTGKDEKILMLIENENGVLTM